MVLYRYANYLPNTTSERRPVAFLRKATPGDVFIYHNTPLVVTHINNATRDPHITVEPDTDDTSQRFLLSADTSNAALQLNDTTIDDILLVRQLACRHCGGDTEFAYLINHSISGVRCTECGFVQTLVYHNTPTVSDPDTPVHDDTTGPVVTGE